MKLLRNNLLIYLLAFIIIIPFLTQGRVVLAMEESAITSLGGASPTIGNNPLEFLKDFFTTTLIPQWPNQPLALTAALSNAPASTETSTLSPEVDTSSYNQAVDRFYIRPWETAGLIECEPWGVGKGTNLCQAPSRPADPPCPIFMDCDGDGYYWWKGEDCDENCPTCYKNSPFTTTIPDGRDQDCDGETDDDVDCLPTYSAAKPYGYDQDCTWQPQKAGINTVVNEGEIGEIPTDELHCQKRWGHCTGYKGGFTNCVVQKVPGYFAKGNGFGCGGGVWRPNTPESIFDCKKALRATSYRGYYGCGLDCLYLVDTDCVCNAGGICCYECQPIPQPDKACSQCEINASFDYPTATNYGPWGICHGYNIISCQEMIGCQRVFSNNRYH
jgi:hypothetical protein